MTEDNNPIFFLFFFNQGHIPSLLLPHTHTHKKEKKKSNEKSIPPP